MLQRLGLSGVFGVFLLLGGVAVVAYENVFIATGMAMVIAGVGFVANGMIQQVMRQFGM